MSDIDPTKPSHDNPQTGDIRLNFAKAKAEIEALQDAIINLGTQLETAVTGLWDYRGNHDASSNLYPETGGSGSGGSIKKSDTWRISVIGILNGEVVTVGSTVTALVDTPGQINSNWEIFVSLSDIAEVISAAAPKTTPSDDDDLGLVDSVTGLLRKLSITNLKNLILTYIESVNSTFTNKTINLNDNSVIGTLNQFNTACSDADFTSIKKDTFANWVTANPILRDGEFGVVSDKKAFVIGNGATDFANLAVYGVVQNTRQKIVSCLVSEIPPLGDVIEYFNRYMLTDSCFSGCLVAKINGEMVIAGNSSNIEKVTGLVVQGTSWQKIDERLIKAGLLTIKNNGVSLAMFVSKSALIETITYEFRLGVNGDRTDTLLVTATIGAASGVVSYTLNVLILDDTTLWVYGPLAGITSANHVTVPNMKTNDLKLTAWMMCSGTVLQVKIMAKRLSISGIGIDNRGADVLAGSGLY